MSLVANERIKLTAGYLNTSAGGLFTTGIVVPVVAVAFGWGVAYWARHAS